MNSINLHDFPKICRFCLKQQTKMTPIEQSQVTEMLKYCQFWEMPENQQFPSQICSTCSKMLKESYKFKKLCKQSQFLLQKTILDSDSVQELGETKVKLEEIDLKVDIYLESSTNKGNLASPVEPPDSKNCSKLPSMEHKAEIVESVASTRPTCKCGKTFVSEQTLKRHAKLHMEKPHICPKCGKGYTEPYVLKRHMEAHLESAQKKYLCHECGMRFENPFFLSRHNMEKHLGEKPFACDECGKRFMRRRELTTHKRSHSGEKPHKCRVCSKGFSQEGALVIHMRTHTGERPYVCLQCNKAFKQSTALQGHVRTHTGEKPFKCTICPREFSLKSLRNNHVRTHTGEKPFMCAVCGHKFRTSSELNSHKRAEHELHETAKVAKV